MFRYIGVIASALAVATPAGADHYSLRDWQALAHVIYGESRGEPKHGQCAVGWSVIYRAEANLPEFGYGIYGVAYKRTGTRWQYDGAAVSVRNIDAWNRSVDIAEEVLNGECEPHKPAMYFCHVVIGACGWHWRNTIPAFKINIHQFYLDPRFRW